MATLIPILEQIEADLIASMADLKQRAVQMDSLLADLETAGIGFDIHPRHCDVLASSERPSKARFAISLKDATAESDVRAICQRHGSDWWRSKTTGNALIYVYGCDLFISGLLPEEQERAA